MKSFSAFVLIIFLCAPTARAANSGSGGNRPMRKTNLRLEQRFK